MLSMNKFFKSERGITLPELLAVFVVISVLGTVIMSFLISGFKAQTRIQLESELRDEADIIMTEVISDLYTLKASEIEAQHLPEENTENYYLQLRDGSIIGFYEGKIHLKDKQTVSLTTDKIRLDPSSKIILEDSEKGLYHISLTLTTGIDDNSQTLTTESKIAIIND